MTIAVHPHHRRIQRQLKFVIILGVAAGLAASFGIAFYFQQTYHFAVVRPGILYRDGNRGLREFSHAVDRAKPRTVVSLIDDHELNDAAKPQFKAEAAYLERNHIQSIRLPVPLGGWPTAADVRTFLSIATDSRKQPILVHCAQGVRRTGMFVAAYQRTVLGYTADRAKAEVKTFGHSTAIADDIDRFIDAYDPATGNIGPLPAHGTE